MDYSELDTLLKHYNLSPKEVATITGRSYDSIRVLLRPGTKVPNWLNLALHIYRLENPVINFTAVNDRFEYIELSSSITTIEEAQIYIENNLDLSLNWKVIKGKFKKLSK